MTDCTELSGRMPDVLSGRSEWLPTELTHLAECVDCAAEWRLVQTGSTLYSGLEVNPERIVASVLSRLRSHAGVVPMRRLPWRHFVLGLAAAASVALAVWVPNRPAPRAVVVTMPSRIGPVLPELSSVTDEQLNRISLASADRTVVGEAGAVPHLSELTESDLNLLSSLTETP